jgi:hypothetical protein
VNQLIQAHFVVGKNPKYMKNILNRSGITCLAMLCACVVTSQVHGQSVTFDFQDGTDQGFGLKFNNDASASFPIVNIGGSLRMGLLRTGAFQEADNGSGSNPLLAAMNAATFNPAGFKLSYDWYVDTSLSPGNYGNFLQVGSYINSGSGAYVQNFGAIKEVELNGTQLASGSVFSGTVTETFAAAYGNPLAAGFQAQTFMRLGLIMNGDGSAATVYFDNISITPVPEPASLSLFGLAVPALWMMRRRKS